ncbi:hypothetical protein LOK49_Contig727G00001 [Camellia lanceoleosa]|nr:hypothetical protein LOK49_Contig727G00001 [Camellia lanceoleosa]
MTSRPSLVVQGVKFTEPQAKRFEQKANVVDGNRRGELGSGSRAITCPEANAELQANLDRWKVMTQANAKSKRRNSSASSGWSRRTPSRQIA